MPFQKMTIDDIPVIAPYFRFVTTNTCDFTVGGMFMWRDYFHMAEEPLRCARPAPWRAGICGCGSS